jgi:microcystin-dependent protein
MTSVLASFKIRQPNTAYNNFEVGNTKTSIAPADHAGWLLCDGRTLSVETYNLLFQLVGYSFGGSGDNFNLPDPRGRATATAGDSADAGITTRAIGDKVGTETHTLTIPEIPSHTHVVDSSGAHIHGIADPGHSHSGTANQASTALNGASNNTGNGANTGTSFTGISINSAGDHTHNIQNTGGSGAHNNMQPTIFLGNTFIYSGVPFF